MTSHDSQSYPNDGRTILKKNSCFLIFLEHISWSDMMFMIRYDMYIWDVYIWYVYDICVYDMYIWYMYAVLYAYVHSTGF